MEIKGIIKQVAREGKAVLLSDDRWYSHFSASTGFQVGDAVKITYTDKVKGDVTYHNWTLIEPSDAEVEVVKPGSVPEKAVQNGTRNTTMYVSYAKDIFCAIFQAQPYGKSVLVSEWTIEDYMKKSIELVKQAKEAFE